MLLQKLLPQEDGGGWRVKVRAALGMGSGTVRYAMRCYAGGRCNGGAGEGGQWSMVMEENGPVRGAVRCGVMREVKWARRLGTLLPD
jgi:hypothetical protein